MACLIHGATLAAAVLAYPHVWPGVTAQNEYARKPVRMVLVFLAGSDPPYA